MEAILSKTVSPSEAGENAVSVLQVVAYNLRRARELRGLTQAKLGEQLTEVTGAKWSSMTVGHAESGWGAAPGRIRHFDAAELVTFAYVLRLPVAWFLLPPPQRPDGRPSRREGRRWITVGQDPGAQAMTSDMLAAYAVAVRGEPASRDPYLARLLEEMPMFLPPGEQETDVRARRLMQRVRDAVKEYESP